MGYSWVEQALVDLFYATLKKVFDQANPGRDASQGLNLHQGSSSALNFSIQFHILAAESNWNNRAHSDAFYNGLTDFIKDELAAREIPTMDDLITIALKIDTRMWETQRKRFLPYLNLHPWLHYAPTTQIQ